MTRKNSETTKIPIIANDTPYNTTKLSNYTLSVKLYENDAIVGGNLSVDYFNSDPIQFNDIPFHIFPSGMEYENRAGNVEIFSVTLVNGTALDYQVLSDQQLMWVNLSDPLIPDTRVQFTINFNTTLPDGGIDRANYYESPGDTQSKIFKFAVAYPMPAVYDEKDGWNLDPYLELGDPFYSDMCFYKLNLEVSKGMKVAATGKLMNTEDLGNSICLHYDPILPTREVTFSASRYFIVESQIWNGVNVSTYFIPRSTDTWHNWALERAVYSLDYYTDMIGEYPYPTFNVVEEYTHYGGMEHPLQVYVTSAADNAEYPQIYLEVVIVHETGHQWFYQIIGNDEVDAGFIDEGMVVFLEHYSQMNEYPEWSQPFEFERLRTYEAENNRPHRINLTVYEDNSTNVDYWYIAYHKAPVIWKKLFDIIGLDAFKDALHLMYDRFKFKIIWFEDVQQAFEDAINQDLNWFFQPWFNNNYLPNYQFENVIYNETTSKISLKIIDTKESDSGNQFIYKQQVPIQVIDKSSNIIIEKSIWINGTTDVSLDIPNSDKPYEVQLVFGTDVLAFKYSDSDTNIIVSYKFEGSGIAGYDLLLLFGGMIIGMLGLVSIYKILRRQHMKM
ncbi:MAG: M1 family metallopeptidase [Promethearchaeota archaeon]